MATHVKEIFERYKLFVKNNPDTCGQIETIVRIGSYLSPGNSSVLSELIHASSNLLTLLNDAILRNASNVKVTVPVTHKVLSSWLTVLEYIEVFIEIAGDKYGGEAGKWIVVICVHVAKAVIRYLLLLKYNSGIQYSPPIPPLKRGKYLNEKLKNPEVDDAPNEVQGAGDVAEMIQDNDGTFVLKRSGRTIRKLSAAPPVTKRSWKLPGAANAAPTSDNNRTMSSIPTPLDKIQTIGESLHIARPLAHLFSMYMFGVESWKPFFVALGIDVSSSCLMGDPKDFNPAEKKELKRRTMLFLLYLLRSPFYDRHFKMRLIMTLNMLANNVPLVRIVIRPILDYLPFWQKLYFYSWQI